MQEQQTSPNETLFDLEYLLNNISHDNLVHLVNNTKYEGKYLATYLSTAKNEVDNKDWFTSSLLFTSKEQLGKSQLLFKHLMVICIKGPSSISEEDENDVIAEYAMEAFTAFGMNKFLITDFTNIHNRHFFSYASPLTNEEKYYFAFLRLDTKAYLQ